MQPALLFSKIKFFLQSEFLSQGNIFLSPSKSNIKGPDYISCLIFFSESLLKCCIYVSEMPLCFWRKLCRCLNLNRFWTKQKLEENGKNNNLKASYKKLFIHLITWVHLDTFSILLTTVHVCMLSRFSCVHLFSTRWTVAHQAPLSIRIL